MSKALISGKVLSIQLGREESRIALVSAGGDVLHSATVPTPAGAVEDGLIRNMEAVRKMLKTAISAREFKGTRKAVFCMATSQVITETVTVPDLPVQKLEKLLEANKDMYFPVDMSEYRMIWQTVGTKARENGSNEQLVQLWAVPLAIVSKYYIVANALGVSLEAVDFCGNTVATAVGASFARPVKTKAKAKKKLDLNMELSFGKKKKEAEEAAGPVALEEADAPPTDLYITLDPDLLGTTFVQNGQVVMQRFIQCGADPALQLDELAMMLEYFRSLDLGRGSEITASVLGSLAGNRELVFELSDMLGLNVSRHAADQDPRWVLLAAAARTARDFGYPALNKARAARKQMGAELWQYVLVLAGGAVLVGIILLTLSSRLIWNAEIRGLENTQQSLQIQAQKTAGYADNYKTYSALYDSYSADWDTLFGSLRTYNDNLVLVLQELEEILPDLTSVLQLQISDTGITATIASDSKEEAAYVIMALREMKYADVAYISNLMGGGGGPVKTYGPKVEKAPTEGGDEDEKGPTSIAGLISKELSQEELMALAVSMSPEEFSLLEQTYGKQPETGYESVDKLKEDKKEDVTFTHRSEAVREMFTTNPFALNHFVDALEADVEQEEPLLYWIVVEELIILESEGKLPSGGIDTAEGMKAYADVLVDILTKNEDNLAAAEAMFATDSYLENSYVHYLEVEMSLRKEETLPFLDLDTVLKDLMSGSFNTTDSELDTKLNDLISQDTWDMLDQMNSEEEMEALLGKYLTDGTTGNEAMDALINEYLTTGTTGSEELDQLIKDKLGDQVLDEKLGQMMQEYLLNGTTGNDQMDELIEAYLTTGTTGNEQMDQLIKDYLGEGHLDEEMLKLLEAYMQNGTTGNTVMDNLIKKYLTEGTTGNKQLDELIGGYIASGELEDIVGGLVDKYLSDGTTGNTVLDGLVDKFFNTGSTGNKDLDKLIEDYINSGDVDDRIGALIQKYFNDGTTGVEALDALLEKYLKTGTTGNKNLDKIIVNYINAGYLDDKMSALIKKYLANKTTGNPVLDELIKKYMTEKTTGNPQLDKMIAKYLGGTGGGSILDDLLAGLLGSGGNGGGMGVTQDTRIIFTVMLQYKEELIQQELDRKGLDYSQKVEKVEVSQ